MHSDMKLMRDALQMLERIEAVFAEHGLTDGEDNGSCYAGDFGSVYGDVAGICATTRLIFEANADGINIEALASEEEQLALLNALPAFCHLNCSVAFDENSSLGVTYDVNDQEWFCYLGRIDAQKPLSQEASAFAAKLGIHRISDADEDADKVSEDTAFVIIGAIAKFTGERLAGQKTAQQFAKELGLNVPIQRNNALN